MTDPKGIALRSGTCRAHSSPWRKPILQTNKVHFGLAEFGRVTIRAIQSAVAIYGQIDSANEGWHHQEEQN